MRHTSLIICTLLFLSCSTTQNKLENKKQILQLHYISWACECANWATRSDIDKYQDTGKLSDHCIFIEPANKTLSLSDTLGYSGDIVEFTGQFYYDKGFPKDYIKTEEPVDKAKIFRYTTYKIIKSNYRDFATKDKNK